MMTRVTFGDILSYDTLFLSWRCITRDVAITLLSTRRYFFLSFFFFFGNILFLFLVITYYPGHWSLYKILQLDIRPLEDSIAFLGLLRPHSAYLTQ